MNDESLLDTSVATRLLACAIKSTRVDSCHVAVRLVWNSLLGGSTDAEIVLELSFDTAVVLFRLADLNVAQMWALTLVLFAFAFLALVLAFSATGIFSIRLRLLFINEIIIIFFGSIEASQKFAWVEIGGSVVIVRFAGVSRLKQVLIEVILHLVREGEGVGHSWVSSSVILLSEDLREDSSSHGLWSGLCGFAVKHNSDREVCKQAS